MIKILKKKLGTEVEFPVKFYESNIIVTTKDHAWSYYKMNGFVYDFLSEDEKQARFYKLNTFFSQIGVEHHLMIIPKFKSIREIHNQFKEKVSGPLREAAVLHTDASVEEIEKMMGSEASDYNFYIGLKLPQLDQEGSLESLTSMIKGSIDKITEGWGLRPPGIPEDMLDRYKNQEATLYRRIINWFPVDRVDEDEIQWLIRRNFYRGIGNPPHLPGFKPKYTTAEHTKKGKTTKYRNPVKTDIMRLNEGLVDEGNGRMITVKQNIDGEEKEGHVAFIVLSILPELEWPGDEWLYAIQMLPFPVEVSVRINPIEHQEALKMVNKKQADIRDQMEHAALNDNDVDLTHVDGNQEAAELKAYLTTAKVPLMNVSVVFAISASTKKELNNRIKHFSDFYKNIGVHTEQPFGDQWPLFNEFMPGSIRYVEDYLHFTETWTMAGSLFGATKQIGDGKGFFLGSHGILNSPVYIDPSLAAKGVEGAKTRSLSAAFIGPVGGGKSFSANLVTYLSVLGGAKALIVDPKGERGNWKKDLTMIKDEINIITLAANEENVGKLDPWSIAPNRKEAEGLAVEIITSLLNIKTDSERFTLVFEAVEKSSEVNPCMTEVVKQLLDSPEEEAQKVGRQLRTFSRLKFASLLFGDGMTKNPITLETKLNILQIQELELPDKSKDIEDYSTNEKLSMAMMLPIGRFAHHFITSDRRQFKIVFIDEAWFLTQTRIGQALVEKMIRAGRSLNNGVFLSTQNANDLLKDEIKSNIGLKFAFQNNDSNDIKNTLKFFGLQDTDDNINTIKELRPYHGEALMQDIYGRTSVVRIDYLFQEIFNAFDTRPPEQEIELHDYEYEQEREPEYSH